MLLRKEVKTVADIQVYTHGELGSIRVLDRDGTIWFVGSDIAKALGYSNTRDAIRKHVDAEDRNTVTIRDTIVTNCDAYDGKSENTGTNRNGTPGNPNKTVINESGLYSLILGSKLPSAKKFKRWVTSEVLPNIRKTGIYSAEGMLMPNDDPIVPMRLLTPDDYLTAARVIAGCRQDRLPIIMNLLRKGGWDLGEGMARITPGRSTADIGAILKKFSENHGKLEDISKLTGISAAVLRSYRVGLRFPRAERYESIVHAIGMLMPDGYEYTD